MMRTNPPRLVKAPPPGGLRPPLTSRALLPSPLVVSWRSKTGVMGASPWTAGGRPRSPLPRPPGTIRPTIEPVLLAADARRSGQRRYRPATLRRLVFIGMLHAALEDVFAALRAETTY